MRDTCTSIADEVIFCKELSDCSYPTGHICVVTFCEYIIHISIPELIIFFVILIFFYLVKKEKKIKGLEFFIPSLVSPLLRYSSLRYSVSLIYPTEGEWVA